MSAPASIAALAFGQAFGTTERLMCPKCLGGGKEEESLSITVDDMGRIHWICFRASCSYKGGPRGVRPVHAVVRKVEPRVYTRPIVALSENQVEALFKKFGTSFYSSGIGYNRETDRFLLPVEGPSHTGRRGYIARSLSGDEPKVLTYAEERPFVHFAYPKNPQRFRAVITEDWFSAEKVAAAGYIGVSIQGTHLNQEMVNEIAALGRTTVIALDKDAFAKSLAYLIKFKEQFPLGLLAVKLEKDLKYEAIERIVEIVSEGTTASVGDDSKQDKS